MCAFILCRRSLCHPLVHRQRSTVTNSLTGRLDRYCRAERQLRSETVRNTSHMHSSDAWCVYIDVVRSTRRKEFHLLAPLIHLPQARDG